MPEKWTGRLIGWMHNERITYEQLANEMGVNKAYISMILNGKRKPPNIQKRMETALEAIIKRGREKQSQKKGEIT
jgi:transcriptional regulator with XRE-family HTH domain